MKTLYSVIAFCIAVAAAPVARAQLALSPAAFAEGAGAFLMDRAGDEVSQFAAEYFYKRLCRETSTSWQVTARDLLGNTCRLLDPDRTITLGLGVFRSALRRDFRGLPGAIVARLVSRLRAHTPGEPDVLRGRQVLLVAMLDLAQAASLAAIENRNAERAFQWSSVSNHLSKAHGTLCLAEAQRFWAVARAAYGPDAIAARASDCQGVALEPLPTVQIQATGLPAVFASPATVTVQAVETRSEALTPDLQLSNELFEAVRALHEAADITSEVQRSREILRSSLRIVGTIAEWTCSSWEGPAGSPGCDAEVTGDMVRAIEDFVLAIHEGKYADALQALLTGNVVQDVLELALAGRNARNASSASERERAQWLDRAVQLLSLAADMATSDSASGVASALDSFAAPVGTWRGKHESVLSFWLQGYAGIAVGPEWLGRPRLSTARGSVGPMLSMGVQMSGSVGPEDNGRLFLYLSLIDVGNVLSVRIDDQSVEATPDVTWAQIFSPGLYGGGSVGRSPFDLMAGCSVVPALRGPAGDRQAAFRCTANLAVDVSIMRLR